MADRTPTLETERLVLRPLVIADAVPLQPLFDDYEVVKYMHAASIPWPYPTDGCRDYYASYLLPEMMAGRTLGWTIVLAAQDQPIGVLQLSPEDEHDSRGFWLGSPYHRQGFITECIVATTDYAFDELGLKLLHLNNAAPNVASRRVKEKAGATLISTRPGKGYVAGAFDQDYWQLTPAAWRASPMKRAANDPSYILKP